MIHLTPQKKILPGLDHVRNIEEIEDSLLSLMLWGFREGTGLQTSDVRKTTGS